MPPCASSIVRVSTSTHCYRASRFPSTCVYAGMAIVLIPSCSMRGARLCCFSTLLELYFTICVCADATQIGCRKRLHRSHWPPPTIGRSRIPCMVSASLNLSCASLSQISHKFSIASVSAGYHTMMHQRSNLAEIGDLFSPLSSEMHPFNLHAAQHVPDLRLFV